MQPPVLSSGGYLCLQFGLYGLAHLNLLLNCLADTQFSGITRYFRRQSFADWTG
ncbi:MAG: hypothetical protein OXC53_00620 [Rhodobacteraceae bacterium]|nr:hypothetical protein [Paracoccaceae bacterium]